MGEWLSGAVMAAGDPQNWMMPLVAVVLYLLVVWAVRSVIMRAQDEIDGR